MPMYPFETKSGASTEVLMDFVDAVPIGDWVTIEGVRLKRLASLPVLTISPELRVTGYTMANDHPALEGLGLARDKHGNPLFDGKKDIDRFDNASQRLAEKDPSIPAMRWGK